MDKSKFISAIQKSYTFNSSTIYLGAGELEGEILSDAKVNLALRMMTRHGLITGATGSGKTRHFNLSQRNLPAKKEKSTFEEVIASPVANQVGRELVRAVFGLLFGAAPRSRSSARRKSIF
jgi:ABC-type branched-subunit amino acid transport system ATPase component